RCSTPKSRRLAASSASKAAPSRRHSPACLGSRVSTPHEAPHHQQPSSRLTPCFGGGGAGCLQFLSDRQPLICQPVVAAVPCPHQSFTDQRTAGAQPRAAPMPRDLHLHAGSARPPIDKAHH